LGASKADLKPHYFDGGLAFMFETAYIMKVNPKAVDFSAQQRAETANPADVKYPPLQPRYSDCWRTLPKIFDGTLNPAFPESAAK
jgi:homogentisate 1,2-dioxygenase